MSDLSLLHLGHLELLSLCNSVNLILLPPHVSIPEGLVQLSEEVLLGTDLFVIVLLNAVCHMLHISVLAQQTDSLLGLVVSYGLHFIQGGHKSRLSFSHQACIGSQLLELAEQISVFGRDSPLALLKVAEVEVHLFDLLGQVSQSCCQSPLRFLSGGLEGVELFLVQKYDEALKRTLLLPTSSVAALTS